MNYNENEFLEQLFGHNFAQQITLPTRITQKAATLSIILEISQRLYLTNFPSSL